MQLPGYKLGSLYVREVVQPGRIPGLGPGGRRFESCPPDNKKSSLQCGDFLFTSSSTMYYVYILYSHTTCKFYCGQTNHVQQRLARHNNGETPSIKAGIPWILVGYLQLPTRKEALQLEKKIKARGIQRWLQTNQQHLISTVA